MYGKFSEILTYLLVRCSGLAQIKYLERHEAALKVLFFELPRKQKLGDTVPPCFKNVDPKSLYKSPEADAYFDLPVFVDHTFVEPSELTRALLITEPRKYSCWKWVSLGEQLRNERKREDWKVWATETGVIKKIPRVQDPLQNVIIDVLGGWSNDLEKLREDKHLWKSMFWRKQY